MKKPTKFFALLAVFGICPGAAVRAQSSIAVGAWGNNDHGQTTVPVAAQNGVMAIAAGCIHTVALKSDGQVVAWGDNQYGQTEVPISAQSGVTATLQSTADLAPPVSWTDSSSHYGIVGAQIIFTNSAHEAGRYFRLLKR